MTKTIQPNQLTETDLYKFTVFASDIGLRAGQWPNEIKVPVGNGRPFYLTRRSAEYYLYAQEFGCMTIKIYND